MDQKQRARMNEEMARQRRTLARMFSEGKVAVLDRFGAPIVKGSLVLWRLNTDLVFQVDDVKVDLRPTAQPGALLMQLSVVVPDVLALANQPIIYMTRVGHTDGVAHSELTSPDATAPPAAVEPVPAVDVGEPEAHPGPKLVLTDLDRDTGIDHEPDDLDDVDPPGGTDDGSGTAH